MREIDLDQPSDRMPKNTFLIHGESRSGKTTWAATFPRPLFLSDASEGGWDSIINMPDEMLFEPGVRPIVWALDKMDDMATARQRAAPLIASGLIQTIVVDSISFYTDAQLNYILASQTKKDTRSAYGDLGTHLRDLRMQTHGLGTNVVWLALTLHPDADNPVGRPMIPGQQGDKFMAGVHFIFHTRMHQEKRGQDLLPPEYHVRTKRYMGYIAGNRLGGYAGNLPDPMVNSTYATMMEALGFDVDAIRSGLPKITPAMLAAAKLPVAAPARPPAAVAAAAPAPVASAARPAAPAAVRPAAPAAPAARPPGAAGRQAQWGAARAAAAGSPRRHADDAEVVLSDPSCRVPTVLISNTNQEKKKS